MKRLMALLAFVFLAPVFAFSLGEELFAEQDLYRSITTTAEYEFLPRFEPVTKSANTLFEDIKVSAIESVPFAVLYTFAGLFLFEAYEQGTLQPKMKKPEEYKEAYFIAAGAFAALNVFVNVFSFYDYSYKGEVKGEKEAKKD